MNIEDIEAIRRKVWVTDLIYLAIVVAGIAMLHFCGGAQ